MTAAGLPCPTCGATVSIWYLDCPCGEEVAVTCATCNLTPSGSALGGWVHRDHVQPDLFEAVGR